jgi:hypothetical protein
VIGRAGLAFAAALALACGGGGGGGGPTTPPPSIVFQPTGTAGENSLALVEGSGSSATRLFVTVRATQVTGLFGVAFDLVYPNGVMKFEGATEGSFLGGTATSFQFSEPTTGRLVVGLTRLGAVSGVNGSGDLLTLEFTPVGPAGVETFAFQSNSAFDATARQISGVSWFGGSATVTP